MQVLEIIIYYCFIFRLCDPIDPSGTKRNDISNLYETLANNFAEVVQYNKDNRQSSKIKNYTIDTICDILVNETKGIPVDRLAEVNSLLLEANMEKCLDYKYSKMIDELRNISWKSEMAEGGRQWFYQTCTEFGFFQTSTARPKLFSETFPVDFFIQQCTDVFGPRYNIHLVEKGVERTNILYGGLHLSATNVVYVHGSIDPWHALGITNSSNIQAPSIYINGIKKLYLFFILINYKIFQSLIINNNLHLGTAHCANMYPASADDLPQLKLARQQIGKLIGKWLE